jgi:hypothetical protein
MIKANGGFPPIKYCSTVEIKKIENSSRKERLYAPTSNNVNIRKILKESKVKPIFDIESNKKDSFDLDII